MSARRASVFLDERLPRPHDRSYLMRPALLLSTKVKHFFYEADVPLWHPLANPDCVLFRRKNNARKTDFGPASILLS